MRKYQKKGSTRNYKPYTATRLAAAVLSIVEGVNSVRKAATEYNIPRVTLSNKVKGRHSKKVGHPTVLNVDEEEAIVGGILTLAEWGFPMDRFVLKMIVRDYLNSTKRKVLVFKNNTPGPDYINNFLNWHKHRLRLRTVSNYSRKRSSVTAKTLGEYFDNLEESLRGIPLENIFNYDETNLSDNPGKAKCLVRRGCRYPMRVMNETKSAISIMFCGNAIGEFLPPFVCYKATGLFSTWRTEGPKGTRYVYYILIQIILSILFSKKFETRFLLHQVFTFKIRLVRCNHIRRMVFFTCAPRT